MSRDDGLGRRLSERVPLNLTDEGGLPGVFRVPPPAALPCGVVPRVPDGGIFPPGGVRNRVGDPPCAGEGCLLGRVPRPCTAEPRPETNLGMLRRVAVSLLKRVGDQDNTQTRRMKAAWDDELPVEVLQRLAAE
jgi:hypothetical protein